jgi:carbon starvation protein
MSLPLLALAVAVALVLGYALYGRFLARVYALDDATPTPAHQKNDGVDFSPTPRGYLLGQHFSAIAAAGPIVGPIVACQQFGWVPCVLWITLGCVLIGAVHDMSALVASVRHGARTVAEIVRQNLSPRAWTAFMAFIWLALLYVIVAFADVTASTFLGKVEELQGERRFNAGGAVAFASIAYLSLAIVMGLVQRRWKPPLWLVTAIFVPATLLVVWLGTQASTIFVLPVESPQRLWGALILGYCFVASLLPVWLLMQPRGYLGGFVLYIVLAVGVVGVFFGDFEVAQPAFTSWTQTDVATGATKPTGLLFPFLFVTIACGACSGFHGLVCSGTTSKQVDKEGDCRTVGFGGMLLEGFVALIALSTVMIIAKPSGGAGVIYSEGMAKYLLVIIGEDEARQRFALTFGAMAFSTFVFDTLDVATRLGRYILEELFDLRGRAGAAMATAATLGLPLLFVLTADTPQPGKPASYLAYWTLFGASNQLLAALTLLGVTVWLRRTGRPVWFTLGPAVFVMAITVTALGRLAWTNLAGLYSPEGGLLVPNLANGLVSCVLLSLAGLLVVESVLALRRGPIALNPGAPASV